MHLEQQTLIAVVGRPISGKTTIAEGIEKTLAIHRLDIDVGRHWATGLPHPHCDQSPELAECDRDEMAVAYRMLLHAADENLKLGRSVIVTATFSRQSGQKELLWLWHEHFLKVRLKIVYCDPKQDSQEEIERRLSRGFSDGGYMGGVNSWNRYVEVKTRYEQILLPCLVLDTGPPHPPEKSIAAAIQYIMAE